MAESTLLGLLAEMVDLGQLAADDKARREQRQRALAALPPWAARRFELACATRALELAPDEHATRVCRLVLDERSRESARHQAAMARQELERLPPDVCDPEMPPQVIDAHQLTRELLELAVALAEGAPTERIAALASGVACLARQAQLTGDAVRVAIMFHAMRGEHAWQMLRLIDILLEGPPAAT